MAEYITLLGSEDIRVAGITIRSAAANIERAAALFDEALSTHKCFMDTWLDRFEEVLKERIK